MTEQDKQEADKLAMDKLALRKSQAGMRFIAQMHIYNGGDFGRLDSFIRDSYHDDMLEAQSAIERNQILMAMHEAIGRVKVKQVVGTHEHQAIVVMEAEKTDKFYYVEMKVEEDYPHKITYFSLQKMQESENESQRHEEHKEGENGQNDGHKPTK
ncbi:MAG: hypothetical protein Q9P44_19975 [Anaerolineae bacterium]|nr:hypothetical protein [Anaerolineae bacterium]